MKTSNKLLLVLGLSLAGVLVYRFGFLRLPARNVPNDNSLLVSPANGQVIAIRPYNTTEYIEPKDDEQGAVKIWTQDVAPRGTIITIRLTLTDVHYQRAPVCSSVIRSDYFPGDKMNVLNMPADKIARFQNENHQMLFQHASGLRYKVVQIAGFFARRINAYILPGDEVNQGDVIGVIKWGSQVSVILPAGVDIAINEGDYLTDGETVIAKLKS